MKLKYVCRSNGRSIFPLQAPRRASRDADFHADAHPDARVKMTLGITAPATVSPYHHHGLCTEFFLFSLFLSRTSPIEAQMFLTDRVTSYFFQKPISSTFRIYREFTKEFIKGYETEREREKSVCSNTVYVRTRD